MKKVLLMLALVGLLSAPVMADVVASQPVLGNAGASQLGASPRGNMIYDDRSTVQGAWAPAVGTPFGEDVTITGTDRWVDSLYWSEWNYTGQATLVSSTVTIQFYQDYTMATSLGGVQFNLSNNLAGGYYQTWSATGLYAQGLRIDLSSATTPMYTVTFSNASPAVAMIGMVIANPIILGSSTDDFWVGPAPGNWYYFTNHSPLANFYFGIDAVPEPATLALLAVGALALIRRR